MKMKLKLKKENDAEIKLSGQVVGAVTKAAVGVAVGRAAATVSEEQGLAPPAGEVSREGGAKRKALVGILSSFLAFLRSNATAPSSDTQVRAPAVMLETWEKGGG